MTKSKSKNKKPGFVSKNISPGVSRAAATSTNSGSVSAKNVSRAAATSSTDSGSISVESSSDDSYVSKQSSAPKQDEPSDSSMEIEQLPCDVKPAVSQRVVYFPPRESVHIADARSDPDSRNTVSRSTWKKRSHEPGRMSLTPRQKQMFGKRKGKKKNKNKGKGKK